MQAKLIGGASDGVDEARSSSMEFLEMQGRCFNGTSGDVPPTQGGFNGEWCGGRDGKIESQHFNVSECF